jgi:hypothetical protein
MKPRAYIAGVLLAGLAAVALAACENSAVVSYCKEMCDCEDCNDEDLDACEAKTAGELDAAGEYDCDDEYVALLDCQADDGKCQKVEGGRLYAVDGCADEAEEYAECVEDASDLDDRTGTTTSTGVSTSSAASGGGTGNVAACNQFVDSVMCGTTDISMYVDCSQYGTTPCDISGYFDCLSSNTQCTDGVLNNSGWAQCATQAQCN